MYTTEYTEDGTEVVTGGLRKKFNPTMATIEECVRVCDVAQTAFEVAEPFFWVDCPTGCTRDNSYYKDGEVHLKPQSIPYPDDTIS